MQAEIALIREFEEELFGKTVPGSQAAVERLLASEFVEFGRSGRIYRKEDVVRSPEPAEADRPQREATDFQLTQLSDDVVLLTYRSSRRLSPAAPVEHSLRSSIWKLVEGRWQMVFHQGTPAQAAP